MCDVCHREAIVSYTGEDADVAVCAPCARERGIEYRRPSPGYISPDAYERNREYYDHAAAANRQRVLDNAGGRR